MGETAAAMGKTAAAMGETAAAMGETAAAMGETAAAMGENRRSGGAPAEQAARTGSSWPGTPGTTRRHSHRRRPGCLPQTAYRS